MITSQSEEQHAPPPFSVARDYVGHWLVVCASVPALITVSAAALLNILGAMMSNSGNQSPPMLPTQRQQIEAIMPKRGWDEARILAELGKPLDALTRAEARDLIHRLTLAPRVKQRPAEAAPATPPTPPPAPVPAPDPAATLKQLRAQVMLELGIMERNAVPLIERLITKHGPDAALAAMERAKVQLAQGGARGVGGMPLSPLETWLQWLSITVEQASARKPKPAQQRNAQPPKRRALTGPMRPSQLAQLRALLTKAGWSEVQFADAAGQAIETLTAEGARQWIAQLTELTKGKPRAGQGTATPEQDRA